jgi:hypothetical protein
LGGREAGTVGVDAVMGRCRLKEGLRL